MAKRMRTPKEETVVVAFESTATAMAFAAAARQLNLEGRLFPVPRTLSAGCGIAWREPARNRDDVTSALRQVDDGGCQVVTMML